MKILYHIQYPEGFGDDRFIYDGYRYAFEDMGHEFHAFTERDDLAASLETIQPDMFITAMHLLNFVEVAPILGAYRKRGGVVVLHAGNLHPGLLNDQKYVDMGSLIKNDQLADIYFAEVLTPHFKDLTGHECHMLPLAADKSIHFPTEPSKRYECDIIYIGAKLPMKEAIFKRRLYPLMKKYRVKTFGGDWDWIDRYFLHPMAVLDRKINLGGFFSRLRISRQVPIGQENVAYSSAKIALNFHEQYDDHIFLNARGFKIPACGGFEICDYQSVIRDYFTEDEMVVAKTDEEFFQAVDYYMAHEVERKAMQERGTARALRDHTWNNRVEALVGWYNELK